MSVVGIIILVILFLILKLITQVTVAEPATIPEITEMELNERIESLENARREIQDEIVKLNQAKQNAAPHIPSLDQMNALRVSIARLEGDVEKIEMENKTAKEYHDEMTNRPDAKHLAETEESIRELEMMQSELQRETQELRSKNNEQTKRQQELRTKQNDLQKQQAALERQLAEDVAKKVMVVPRKSTDKTPYLLIYGQGKITVLSHADPKGLSFTSRQAFFNWVQSRNPKTEYIVLYVKPSRFEEQKSILESLQKMGFETGLQVIGEKTEIVLQ